MTSNLAEVYNWVIRGLRGCPLVGIIEGILYGIIKYYQKRHAAAVLHSTTVQTPYCNKMYIWMDKAVAKASQHIVIAMGTHDNHFEITVRAKGGVGRETTLVTHEVNLGRQFDGRAECTCNKPMLLHVPRSHGLGSFLDSWLVEISLCTIKTRQYAFHQWSCYVTVMAEGGVLRQGVYATIWTNPRQEVQ